MHLGLVGVQNNFLPIAGNIGDAAHTAHHWNIKRARHNRDMGAHRALFQN